MNHRGFNTRVSHEATEALVLQVPMCCLVRPPWTISALVRMTLLFQFLNWRLVPGHFMRIPELGADKQAQHTVTLIVGALFPYE
jgi:hypothetical protein